MSATLRKHLDQADQPGSLINKLSIYPKLQTTADGFESPVSGDLCLLDADSEMVQSQPLLTSESRVDGTREPQSTIPGPIPAAVVPVSFEWRPPRTLAGTSVPMGLAILAATAGPSRYVNSQAAVTIFEVVSYQRLTLETGSGTFTPSNMVLRVLLSGNTYKVGDGFGLLPYAGSEAAGAMSEPTVVTAVSTGTGPSSLYQDLTCSPAFSIRPVATGDTATGADQIQGGGVCIPDPEFAARYSNYMINGLTGAQGIGGVGSKLTAGFDRKSIFKLTGELRFRKVLTSNVDYVIGHSGAFSFATTDLTLDVLDATRQFEVQSTGGSDSIPVDLVLVDVATNAETARESKALIKSVDRYTNILTFASRGSSPISVNGTTHTLRVVTSTQEVAEMYDLTTRKYLTINIDNRGWIDINLTYPVAPAAAATTTAAEVAHNINWALAHDPRYGTYGKSLTGRAITWGLSTDAADIVYSGAASVVASKVRITSKCFGSQSGIAVRAYADATLDAGVTTGGSRIFTGAFTLAATDEIQILPWTPGGTETRKPLVGMGGFSKINGAVFRTQALSIDQENAVQDLDGVRTDDTFVYGFVPGLRRVLKGTATMLGEGWAERLQQMIRDADSTQFMFWVWDVNTASRTGSVFWVYVDSAKMGGFKRGGSNVRENSLEFMPEQSGGPTGIPAVIIGWC